MSHVFNASGEGEETILVEAADGNDSSVTFVGDGFYIFRVTCGSPAIRMIGDGHKTVSFFCVPNFSYDSNDAAPKAISADGNCTLRLFGEADKLNIFHGSIELRDGGPPGNVKLELCGGDWLLIGTYDGVDIATAREGTTYDVLGPSIDCATELQLGALLGFFLLESTMNAPLALGVDGIGLSTQCLRTKMSGSLPGRALQACTTLSIGKSFCPRIVILPSCAELSIGIAAANVRGIVVQTYRQQIVALRLHRSLGHFFLAGHLGGTKSTALHMENCCSSQRATCYSSDAIAGFSSAYRHGTWPSKKELLCSASIGIGRRNYANKCNMRGQNNLYICNCETTAGQTFLRSNFGLAVACSHNNFFMDSGVELGMRYVTSTGIDGNCAATDRLLVTVAINFAANWPRMCLEATLSEHFSEHSNSIGASAALCWCF
jgi:hypothetical protein